MILVMQIKGLLRRVWHVGQLEFILLSKVLRTSSYAYGINFQPALCRYCNGMYNHSTSSSAYSLYQEEII
jgi:hypothetical protein